MSYKLLPDNDNRNSQSTCNNVSCPTKTIYWNPQVVHYSTGRMTPLEEPFNSNVRPPKIHRCMKQFKPGVFLDKYDNKKREEENWNKLSGYTGPVPPAGVHLGTTHLWVNAEFVPLYKCPLCSFQNIHKDIINHHIKFASDSYHNQSGKIID